VSSQTQSLLADPIPTIAPKVPNQRFTIDGSPELEDVLLRLCNRARKSVLDTVTPARIEGMLLGGGYGRGEGGVLRSPEGDKPYNDLEFYVFLKGLNPLRQNKYQHILHHCAEELTPQARIEIELRATSFAKLRRSRPGMFYYDLVMGHKWIIGNEQLLAGCEHHRQAELIPLSEATRLLMNRCSGLLFAKERLQRSLFSAQDADFVARNMAKAKLALGDIVLTMLGQYHWSFRERSHRVAQLTLDLPWFEQVRRLHPEGVEFKLHPHQADLSADQLRAPYEPLSDLARQIWLWLEARRLGQNFEDPTQYAFDSSDKCPETARWRNALINLRTKTQPWCQLFRYPRDRVLRSLPLLLWCWPINQTTLRFLQRQLSTSATDFSQLVDAYRALWAQFN